MSYVLRLAIPTITLILAGLALVNISSAQTPEPTSPSITQDVSGPPVCPPNSLGSQPARQVTVGAVMVSLPEGPYFAIESPPGSGHLVACHRATAGVRLSGNDCSELGRFVTASEENTTLDLIVASCSLNASQDSPTATPATTTPSPTATDVTGIRPPDTGSAGLR